MKRQTTPNCINTLKFTNDWNGDNKSLYCYTNSWSSHIWIAPKEPDATKQWRIIVNYRNINDKNIQDKSIWSMKNLVDVNISLH